MRMAVGVVDRLEAVEVDEEQRQPAAARVGLGRGGGEAVLEVDARRQLRQVVDGAASRCAGGGPRGSCSRLVPCASVSSIILVIAASAASSSASAHSVAKVPVADAGRHRRGERDQGRAGEGGRAARDEGLAARLELEREADQHACASRKIDRPGPQEPSPVGQAKQARRREHRVAVGDQQRHVAKPGERRQRLARRRDRRSPSPGRRARGRRRWPRRAVPRTPPDVSTAARKWPATTGRRRRRRPRSPSGAGTGRGRSGAPRRRRRRRAREARALIASAATAGQQPLAIQKGHEELARPCASAGVPPVGAPTHSFRYGGRFLERHRPRRNQWVRQVIGLSPRRGRGATGVVENARFAGRRRRRRPAGTSATVNARSAQAGDSRPAAGRRPASARRRRRVPSTAPGGHRRRRRMPRSRRRRRRRQRR